MRAMIKDMEEGSITVVGKNAVEREEIKVRNDQRNLDDSIGAGNCVLVLREAL